MAFKSKKGYLCRFLPKTLMSQNVFLLLLLFFMPLFCGFFLVQNASAVSVGTASLGIKKTFLNPVNYQWQYNIGYNQIIDTQAVQEYQFTTPAFTPTGNTLNIHFETNIVATSFSRNYINFVNLSQQSIRSCVMSGSGSAVVSSSSLSSVVTQWTTSDNVPASTVTFYGDVILSGVTPNVSQTLTCRIGSDSFAFFTTNNTANVAKIYFEKNPINILYNTNLSDSLLQGQNNLLETQNSLIQDQNNKENASVDNIENQSPDDYSDTENQATTNIIGVISSFFGQFTNFTPTTCEITLPFPDFFGGSMTQNICSGKEQAGEIISIVGSLIMVGFYIPLAFALLKMIYSEIRSFTNG